MDGHTLSAPGNCGSTCHTLNPKQCEEKECLCTAGCLATLQASRNDQQGLCCAWGQHGRRAPLQHTLPGSLTNTKVLCRARETSTAPARAPQRPGCTGRTPPGSRRAGLSRPPPPGRARSAHRWPGSARPPAGRHKHRSAHLRRSTSSTSSPLHAKALQQQALRAAAS